MGGSKKGTVVIDCFPESAFRYKEGYAVVVIDVIRATTTAATAVGMGMRVFPARTTDEAFVLAAGLEEPLLVGELGGNMPYNFDMTNSPAQIALWTDVHRPAILVSSSGTQLLLNAQGAEATYIACFRNFSAVARYLAGRHERVAVLGAGTRGQFRREDQMGCAWVAKGLIGAGYQVGNLSTAGLVNRWKQVSSETVRYGRSADYLRKSNQEHDLEFIVSHLDDLDVVVSLKGGELVRVSGTLTGPTSAREDEADFAQAELKDEA